MTRLSTLVSALLSPLPPPLCGFWGAWERESMFGELAGLGQKPIWQLPLVYSPLGGCCYKSFGVFAAGCIFWWGIHFFGATVLRYPCKIPLIIHNHFCFNFEFLVLVMTDMDLPDLGAHSQLGKSAFFQRLLTVFCASRRFAYFFTLVTWEQYIGQGRFCCNCPSDKGYFVLYRGTFVLFQQLSIYFSTSQLCN